MIESFEEIKKGESPFKAGNRCSCHCSGGGMDSSYDVGEAEKGAGAGEGCACHADIAKDKIAAI